MEQWKKDAIEALSVPYSSNIADRSELPRYWGTEIDGEVLYVEDSTRIFKSITTNGKVVAVKVAGESKPLRAEASMMQHASKIPGLKVPKVLGCYTVNNLTVVVSKFVPGQTLEQVWLDLSEAQRLSLKMQLKSQLGLMQTCTLPYIGRVDRQPVYSVYGYTYAVSLLGPFNTEAEWDKWCLERVLRIHGPSSWTYWKWKTRNGLKGLSCVRALRELIGLLTKEGKMKGGLEALKREILQHRRPEAFVLTHGDFAPRNIMVQDGVLTGIIDWEFSGFYPRYMERGVFRAGIMKSHGWWTTVLNEILPPVSSSRVRLLQMMWEY